MYKRQKVDSVVVSLICYSDHRLLKAACTRCFGSEKWKFAYEELPLESYLNKCAAMIRILTGSSVLDVGVEDGCLLFHDYAAYPIDEEVRVQWWKDNAPNTKLNEYIVRMLA